MRTLEQIKQASLITAIKTPYLASGEIDLATYDYLVEQQIAAGVDGIVVGGTTGEGQLMNWEEHLMLIAHSVNKYADKLVIVGNTGSNNTREAVKATEYGFASGMDAALQINPYYGRTSIAGVIEHFKRVLAIGPAFIYNVAGRTGQDLTPDIIEPLAQHENFIGVKECGGNERIEHYEQQGIACWSGNDDEAHDARHTYKAHGVISVTSNLIPGLYRQLMDSKSDALNASLQPLISWLFCEPNPIAINTALMMTGAVKPVFRLPYVPLNEQQQAQGVTLINQLDDVAVVGGSKATPLNLENTIILP
ncbi:MAG: 4-hydroxy-tetrahydrodipicolinate synthase [Pseudoalteromonas rhizosphaerae]|jgi:4-hydroxy-tetrahydrodipicolinate synthase|uniref:4-hydroxy-tetrahydrodipicolinate synthase n=1 Tax=Pseudoalteromonas neustonica TaxID=1840331 RepID=A0ABY3FFA4_9GAMM|nr:MULTISPECIES: 4-hydroxy-tetrahydrodipicolinate synthase [Pseudoalteromonas]MBB1301616.1 4-hydroxy-tetrahydrodipicolinate synthase [Pseudoalteromonas sp. SR44-8]MBB1309844.1 4-hydroxy-tetrahydrodipicolinate synthase [Pseudoalteromonas sp. SR41-8]MBB1396371.1 4-hydroxy-tetrahydrodipicolinate synthase [Pseudoalteromonas sp. SG44-8]MBB1409838.1 4-hydroxy-tetrahydrodipicolinate synthase [Pseudoalteromonas sp. SG44-17]TVU84256.1 4-hydroxy-tetrahydrodipicolinate synthase [Pseudoalteromonas neuston